MGMLIHRRREAAAEAEKPKAEKAVEPKAEKPKAAPKKTTKKS